MTQEAKPKTAAEQQKLWLTRECRARLADMAEAQGLPRSGVVENLINEAYEKDRNDDD